MRCKWLLLKQASSPIHCADEIDAIGKARGDDQGGSNEREQGLMQILYEMDGFYKNDKVTPAVKRISH